MKTSKANDLQLLDLERSLKSGLNPIQPDQQFVGNLRRRLEDMPVYHRKQRLAVSMLSIAAGLVVGLAIFLIGRSFVHSANETS